MIEDTDDNLLDNHSILSQYKHIVDATNIVSKTDIHGIITYANSKFIEISGYSRDELIGKSHNIVRDPDSPSDIFKELWSTIKSKKIWNGVITNRCKDGTKYTVEASIFPIIDDLGEIVEYIAIRHDISELLELNKKINALHAYDTQQQKLAREKLEAGIVNDLAKNECRVFYQPSDILSGDFYSIYKLKDGSTFIYLIDGQGHGISPALTVFAVSATIAQIIENVETLEDLTEQLFPTLKTFLGEIEQLSFTMILINKNSKELSYTSGGMYPFLIKKADTTIKVKANNIPFMNFSTTPIISEVDISGWNSIMLFSDGIVEHENENLREFTPDFLIENSSALESVIEKMSSEKFDDDVTLLYLKNQLGNNHDN